MKAYAMIPFVDTNIIPDRNAGIGSLLWDLQNPHDPDRDGPPLLGPEFAFIDVGVSRAKVAIALKTLLVSALDMNVHYVATERVEAVPYAHVSLLGDRAETIRACLSRMISSRGAPREVADWHVVVDRAGRVSSLAYSYLLHGNEVWESYFMGRAFMVSGVPTEFVDGTLDEMLATDVSRLETRINLEVKRESDSGHPSPSWDGYRIETRPLEAGLAEAGITFQRTEVPQRIKDRQNVLFLGNVLNHYPQDEQARALDRIAVNMQEGDVIIVQDDEAETASLEVLHVIQQGAGTARERMRWIDTRTLQVLKRVRGAGSHSRLDIQPAVARAASRLNDCLGRRLHSPDGRHEHAGLRHQYVSLVFRSFFRALPVQETLRVAIREALRRLPSDGGLRQLPVFTGDAEDAHGGALGPDMCPIVTEDALALFGASTTPPRGNSGSPTQPSSTYGDVPAHSVESCCRGR